jgi:predicted Holliday junction resolvase-like endonuclease
VAWLPATGKRALISWPQLLAALAAAALLGALAATIVLVRWRRRFIRQSRAVTTGKVAEQLAPHMQGFPLNPREARFLGSPVDFVVFDGLEDGAVRRVVFVEVKTGGATLSGRERLVRDAVRDRRVEWVEWRPQD